jgi:micrococcal nuclease
MQPPDQRIAPISLPQRWAIGIDRRRVAVYVTLALAAGFALGYLTARQVGRSALSPETYLSDKEGDAQAPPSADAKQDGFHKVSRIARADTIEVEGVGLVRLLGVETPDGKAPAEIYGLHGRNALAFTERSLLGQQVRLESDSMSPAGKDEAGQTLAYVYTPDGTLFNGEMIKQGHAFAQVKQPFLLIDQFRLLERDAMQAMRGVWGLAGQPPAAQVPATTVAGTTGSGGGGAGAQEARPKRLAPLAPEEIGPNLPTASAAAAPGEPAFFVSSEDKMYHKRDCQYLGKNRRSMSLAQAKADGYSACSHCFASTVLRAK